MDKKLSDLRPGDSGFIKKVSGRGSLSKRLLDMGAVGGTRVEVVKKAPLGYPMDVLIKGYHLTLRKEEADRVLITVG